MRTLLLGLLACAGCSRGPDLSGEEWAKKALGAEASALKWKAKGAVTGLVDASPYAPRPLAVVELVYGPGGSGEGEPRYHPINATLPAAPGSAADVRCLVVVQKTERSEKAGTIRIKRRTENVWDHKPIQVISILVRGEEGNFREAANEVLEGHEDETLRAWLEKLPEAPPNP